MSQNRRNGRSSDHSCRFLRLLSSTAVISFCIVGNVCPSYAFIPTHGGVLSGKHTCGALFRGEGEVRRPLQIPGLRNEKQDRQNEDAGCWALKLASDDNSGQGGGNQWSDDGGEGDDGDSMVKRFSKWAKSDEAREDVKVYTISLTVALLLRFLIIEPRYIPSLSMYPTFDVGDQIAVEKVTKRLRPFERKEVVVFNPPPMFNTIMGRTYGEDVASKRSREALIKRIVAVEGDEVSVRNGQVYINGEVQDEPYTAEDAQYEFGPTTVPPGQLLVLGDNRNHSFDGHIWGFVPKGNVIGRAVFTYWPPWRIGSVNMY